MSPPWLIYGANGYTGELIAREACRRNLTPILAGRNREKLQALATELNLEARIFPLDTPADFATHLRGCALVLHCAGPFSATAAPMMEACLAAGTHYLDITGEIGVFEHVQTLGIRAREKNIVLCPGVGFDVIPTDCVAAALKTALPDATHLALGFDSRSAMSPGTSKTSVEGLAQGGRVRRNGRIVAIPLAGKTRQIDFGNGEKTAMAIPWGDVATAFYTTGIPNIEVYIPASPRQIATLKRMNLLRPLLKLSWVQAFLKARIAKRVKGPDQSSRDRAPTYVWGEAVNPAGETRTARVRTANGYSLTVSGALAVVEYLSNTTVEGGAYTPAKLVGLNLVTSLPGSGPIIVT